MLKLGFPSKPLKTVVILIFTCSLVLIGFKIIGESSDEKFLRQFSDEIRPPCRTTSPKRIKLVQEINDTELNVNCSNTYTNRMVAQRGNYYVFYNYIQANIEFGCTQSVTLSAPGDYRFLDNVIPLVDRWLGPISIALYAPGDDFYKTLDAIAHLRNCYTSNIRELVTFHLFFEADHVPKLRNGIPLMEAYEDRVNNCSESPPWEIEDDENMYKTLHNLLYPINVARNVAKLASQTYFVFPSDIELYPTRNFTNLFMEFVRANKDLIEDDRRNVFVLPIFEIKGNEKVPETKTALQKMLGKKTAFLFHQKVCAICHRVINGDKWTKAEETTGLSIFSTGKRHGPNMVWEPFFVCTQKEPLWDERLSWEGQSNKMVQAYTMCVLDYTFMVFDNAFLIHKPGVKKKKVQMERFQNVVKNSNKLMKRIAIELTTIYGSTPNCSVIYISQMKKKPIKPAVKIVNSN